MQRAIYAIALIELHTLIKLLNPNEVASKMIYVCNLRKIPSCTF
jgi:hypothetical protein